MWARLPQSRRPGCRLPTAPLQGLSAFGPHGFLPGPSLSPPLPPDSPSWLGLGDRAWGRATGQGGHQAPERPVWIMETLTLGGAASAQKSRFLPLGEPQGPLNLSLDPGMEKPTARFCFRT